MGGYGRRARGDGRVSAVRRVEGEDMRDPFLHPRAIAGNHAVRGWCPSAWRPMEAGDGWLVRIRPPLGRLSRAQTMALHHAVTQFGNGRIDLTNRAALQIRGVAEAHWQPLIERLVATGLVDPTPERDARRNILLNPDWRDGDDTHRIACALVERIDELPDLPAKFGIAIDAGPAPALSGTPADFRVERGVGGGLILRAEGRTDGLPISVEDAVDALVALAHWFVATDGHRSGRMARHAAALPTASKTVVPLPSRSRTETIHAAHGVFCGAPFGQIEAGQLASFLSDDGVRAIRLTPWRGVLLEGARAKVEPALDPDDPLFRVDACPGRPACPQATVPTRDVALRLARHVEGHLHVSGCSKGCACPGEADVVLTGRDGRFDLAHHARAGGSPAREGLDPDQIFALFGAS
jgi:precorrin-3B synthase